MKSDLKVLCVGEVLIDFVSKEKTGSLALANSFIKAPGGAPANVAVGLSRLGTRSGFMGKVGNDPWGLYLIDVLKNEAVDIKGVVLDHKVRTTITFVSVSPEGEREFAFYRNPGADMLWTKDEINIELIQSASILHFGSVSLSCEPAKAATLQAVKYARDMGKMISFDPNIREGLWDDKGEIKSTVLAALPLSDIVKLSDEEAEVLFGCSEPEKAARAIREMGVKLVFITLGKNGCYYQNSSCEGYQPCPPVKVQDTTGAGDSFVSAVLHSIACGFTSKDLDRIDLDVLTKNELDKITLFANTAASITVTRTGAIPALPTLEEVNSWA